MTAAPTPPDEELRLRTLYSYGILDTMAEEAFDDLCRVAAAVCDAPISLVSLLDRRRQWFKARVGLDVEGTERDSSFCSHAILGGDLLMVEDATRDQRFVDNRLVLQAPHIRFYAGVPLTAFNGQRLGALCVIDDEPRTLDDEQRTALRALARQAEAQLELRRIQAEKDILGRFVVHDLRNPLTSLLMGLDMATREVARSSLREGRLTGLRESAELLSRRVEDFHALLTSEYGALPVRVEEVDLVDLVRRLEEAVRPRLERIEVALDVCLRAPTVQADPDLLGRALENLVYNALSFAPPRSAVHVESWSEGDAIHVRVSDHGPGIPEDERPHIFELYRPGPGPRGRQSTGLGLAFCQMAARAMGGSIDWDDPGDGAAFRLTLPHHA